MTLVAKETSLLLTWFATLFFSGFFLANSILIGASFIPLFIHVSQVLLTPIKVQVKKTGLPRSTRLGETVEVKIDGKITGGPGAVVVYDEVPGPFQLIEGTNYKVVSKEFNEKVFSFSYKIKCDKCGNYLFGVGWEARHILGLARAHVSVEEEIGQLRVYPVLSKLRKVKLLVRNSQRTQPTGGSARIGPLSTDFREIRNYFYGDPFKIINWKASARAASKGSLYPLVNEYEREGKLTVWLFLNANPDLKIGDSIENTLEYGIRAAYLISHYCLTKGYRLGMYVYDHRGETFHTDSGKQQFLKIAEGLIRLTLPKVAYQVFWDEGFSKAVERNREYLMTQSPLTIILTHVTARNYGDLLNGLRRILAYRRRRQHPNILLINILPYTIVPNAHDRERFAAQMLTLASRSFSNKLRDLGLTVLDWDPRRESIEDTLSSTMRLR